MERKRCSETILYGGTFRERQCCNYATVGDVCRIHSKEYRERQDKKQLERYKEKALNNPLYLLGVCEKKKAKLQDDADRLAEALRKYKSECETVAPDPGYRLDCRISMFKILKEYDALKGE